jgi:hypothetical protein
MSDGDFITIKYPTLPNLEKRLAEAPAILRDELRTGMQRSTMLVERDAKAEVDVDTGTLRRSISRTVEARIGHVRGTVGTNQPHARAREFDRPPGKMPPRGALLDWMRRHGIDPENEFVIRRKIGTVGSPGKPYLRPALEKNRDQIRRELGTLAWQRTARRLRAGR